MAGEGERESHAGLNPKTLRSEPEQKSGVGSPEAQPTKPPRQILLKYHDLCSVLGSYKVLRAKKGGCLTLPGTSGKSS